MVSVVAHLRALTRLLLVHALYYTGVLHLLKRRLRGRAVVLMYHRVLDASERERSFSSDGIQVSPETFDRHLHFLRRHFKVLAPDEFVQRLHSGQPFDDATCLITFDDGWSDNLTNAMPLLRKHALPAVIFLPTGFVGSDRCFWQETLARLLHRLHGHYRHCPSEDAIRVIEACGLKDLFRSDGAELKQRIHDFVRGLKALPEDEVNRMAEAVRAVVGDRDATERHPDRFVSWEEARTMAAAGLSFGSHAVSHRILTRLDARTLAQELTASKAEIGRQLDTAVPLLAYPNGDSDQEVAEAARSAGYAAAFTTRPATVAAGEHPFLVPRVNIHDRGTRTVAGFYATLLGVL